MATILDSFTWVVSPTGALGYPGPKMPYAATVVEVSSFVTAATSATFNIEARDTIGSAANNVLTTDMVADVTGESVTSSFNDGAIAKDQFLWLDVASIVGTPGYLQVCITFSYSV